MVLIGAQNVKQTAKLKMIVKISGDFKCHFSRFDSLHEEVHCIYAVIVGTLE